MNDNRSFQKFAAVTAILAAPIAIASTPLALLPVGFNPEAFDDPTILLSVGTSGTSFVRWGLLTQMLGYYLLLLPAALFLWRWLKPKSPNYVGFYSICGLIYILTGAIAIATLWGAFPYLIQEYATATGQQREMLAAIYSVVTEMALDGVGDIVGLLPAAIWWLGIGALLRRERKALGLVTILAGIPALLITITRPFGISLGGLGLFAWLILTPLWSVWLGIDLLRKPVQVETPQQLSGAPTAA